ncbi:PH domain-containing protein [Paenibacillus sp. N4]|uniref:PH domain-containing protein n=1 Tax=Paenibacillus vietnamensis TaxID=2590547 RepID=UPI001CD1204E|nr:PH domain-containing protein [Paenibacillus vietnamensis]MCA0756525.1 PH domain-containing protein [Paenibacillus vietnamensis]
MFGKLAADALGLSDIGSVIKPADYSKVDSDDYVMHEDNEKIYFLIKSKTDEYCFTNLALIHLDGTSAMSKKRTLRRYTYSANPISQVALETAGTVDLDVEIKFTIGPVALSIDINKKHIEEVKDLYKALIKISEITRENEITLEYARRSLDMASSTLQQIHKGDFNVVDQFDGLNKSAFNWLVNSHKQYRIKDFGSIFERYINN